MGSPPLPESVDAEPTVVAQTTDQPRLAVIGFYIVAVLFNLCLDAQLLTVGLADFENLSWWQVHVWLVRGYSSLSLVLMVWVYGISFPRRIRILTVSMPILLGIQFLTIHWHPLFLPLPLAIVHPLVGFFLVSVSSTLVHRVWHIVSPQNQQQLNSI